MTEDVKANLRRHSLERRDLVSQQEAHEAAARVCESARALIEKLRGAPNGLVISAYWPIRSEINTRPLIEALHRRGAVVALPAMVAVRRPLIFHVFEPEDKLVKGPFGLSEPCADKPEVFPEIVLAPLAAFDRTGARLGYGGGIYDATLGSLRLQRPVTAIGLAYAFQEADAVPIETHDQKLNYIVTEREMIRCP